MVKVGSNKITARISYVDPSIIEANTATTPADANIVKHFSVYFKVQNTQVLLPLPPLTLLILQKQ